MNNRDTTTVYQPFKLKIPLKEGRDVLIRFPGRLTGPDFAVIRATLDLWEKVLTEEEESR